MDIKWYGGSAFSIKTKSATAFIDPGLADAKLGKTTADFKLVSGNGADSDKVEATLVISEPGEYEVRGVMVEAINASRHTEAYDANDTLTFVLRDEGVNVMHLGSLKHTLADELIGDLGQIDILLVPAGGGEVLDVEKADQVIRTIEPRVVIPYAYGKSDVEKVSKALGGGEAVDKYSITKSGLPEETTEIVILKASE